VAIFLTGSTTSDIAIVDSGFVPPSATPAAADVAVPSLMYRTWLAVVVDWPNTSRTPNGSNNLLTTPGSYCGATSPPPGPPTPVSSMVPFTSCIDDTSTGPVVHVWPRPDGSRIFW
jgi:hypothetical protein